MAHSRWSSASPTRFPCRRFIRSCRVSSSASQRQSAAAWTNHKPLYARHAGWPLDRQSDDRCRGEPFPAFAGHYCKCRDRGRPNSCTGGTVMAAIILRRWTKRLDGTRSNKITAWSRLLTEDLRMFKTILSRSMEVSHIEFRARGGDSAGVGAASDALRAAIAVDGYG